MQTVLAMALDCSIEEMETESGTQGSMSVDDALRLLARRGIPARPVAASLVRDFWDVFSARAAGVKLEGLGIRLPRTTGELGHAVLLHSQRIYDPATGQSNALRPDALGDLDWLILVGGQSRA